MTQFDCAADQPWEAVRTLVRLLQQNGPVELKRYDGRDVSAYGQTLISIYGPVIERIYQRRREYFLELDTDTPFVQLPGVDVYRGMCHYYYVEGLQCVKATAPTRFTYHFTNLSYEQAKERSNYQMQIPLIRGFLASQNKDAITEVLTAPNETAESTWAWATHARDAEISRAFEAVLGYLVAKRSARLSYQARTLYSELYPKPGLVCIEMTAEHVEQLRPALERIRKLGCNVSLTEITLVKDLVKSNVAQYIGETLYIAEYGLSYSTDDLAAEILMSYYEHLRNSGQLMSVSFEQWIARFMVRVAEDLPDVT